MKQTKTSRSAAQETPMNLLSQLRNLDCDRIDLDDAIALSALGRSVITEYEALGWDTPEWLTVNLKSLRREIRSRIADTIEHTLRAKQARLAALKPAEERRKDLQAEIEDLQKKVAAMG
jgi:hypothetical protein